MSNQDYKVENEVLRQRVADLEKTNNELVIHNMQLSQKMDAYYDVRRRIYIYKELLARHTEFLRHADLRSDDELLAVIESRLETERTYENPDFGVKELAEMIDTSQSRILDLFRNSPLYKSVEDYLDYLRILRSMYYLMSKREWNVAACAQEAGFSAIRSFNRKFQDAIGMSPHEFRKLLDSHPTPQVPVGEVSEY
jgi:transcriptional regulator GlxA family with amidase domain